MTHHGADERRSSSKQQAILNSLKQAVNHNKAIYFDVDDYQQAINLLLQQNDLNTASYAIKSAMLIHPKVAIFELQKARLLLLQGLHAQALSVLQTLNCLPSQNSLCYFLEATALLMCNQIKQAQVVFCKAVNVTAPSKRTPLLHNIAQAYLNAQQFKQAETFFKHALRFNPNHKPSLKALCNLYAQQNNYKQLLQCSNNYLDQNPFDTQIWCYYGNAQYHQNNLELALDAFENALALNHETNNHAWLGKAKCLLLQKKYHAALQSCQQALKLNDVSQEALCLAALCCSKLDATSLASARFYRKAFAINPSCIEALQGLALIAFNTNNYNKANYYLAKALKINPECPQNLFLKARVAVAQQQYTLAQTSFEAATNANLKNSDFWKCYAQFLAIHQNKPKQAIAVLRKALEIFETA